MLACLPDVRIQRGHKSPCKRRNIRISHWRIQMPLLDHFRPPLYPRHQWASFHSNWATRIADALNRRWLPPGFLAEEYTTSGARLEIDVATFDEHLTGKDRNGPTTTTLVAPA